MIDEQRERHALLTLIWQRMCDRRPELYVKTEEGCGVLDILREVMNQAEIDFANGARPRGSD